MEEMAGLNTKKQDIDKQIEQHPALERPIIVDLS